MGYLLFKICLASSEKGQSQVFNLLNCLIKFKISKKEIYCKKYDAILFGGLGNLGRR